jgi:hypothetical protein
MKLLFQLMSFSLEVSRLASTPNGERMLAEWRNPFVAWGAFFVDLLVTPSTVIRQIGRRDEVLASDAILSSFLQALT